MSDDLVFIRKQNQHILSHFENIAFDYFATKNMLQNCIRFRNIPNDFKDGI